MKGIIFGFFKENMKWIILIAVVAIIIISLAGFSYVLKLIDSSNPNHSSGAGNSSSYSGNNMNAQVESKVTSQISLKSIVKKDNGEYKYDIDLDAKVNEIYDELNKSEGGRRTLSYINGDEQQKKQILKNMIRAEIITQYPDLRSTNNMGNPLEDNEMQGCIQFKRIISEPTIKKVESIKKSENTSIELEGGIACWGDDFTLGNIENSSDNYPTKLGEKISKHSYNLGFSGVTSTEIVLMAGASGYSLQTYGEESVLGAEANSETKISVCIKKDDTIKSYTPFKTFDGSDEKKKLKCAINGIEGELIYKDSEYIFKRINSGEEVEIKPETKITIRTQAQYSKAFPIIWMGNNNSYISYQNRAIIKNLVEEYRTIINMSNDPDNYIVIIPTHYRTDSGELIKYEQGEYNSIKQIFLAESGFNQNQVLDLYDYVSDGSEFDDIVNQIEDALKRNNINTELGGDYTPVPNEEIITLSNEYLPADGSTAITLEYIPLGNQVAPLPGTLMWMINNDDIEIKKAAMQYFSVDDFGNIVVANWTKTTTTIENMTDANGGRDEYVNNEGSPNTSVEYTISRVKLNYKSSISNYTMPFDYLWTLLVMSEDTKFVQNITSLALNSEITATLYDEMTSREEDVVEELTNGYKTYYKQETHYFNADGTVRSPSTTTDYYGQPRYEDKKKHTNTITQTNKVRYKLTYADVWCLNYKAENIIREEYNGADGSDPSLYERYEEPGNEPETWDIYGEKRYPDSTREDHYKTIYAMGSYEEVLDWYSITNYEEQDYKMIKDHKTITTIISSGYKYSEGTTNVKEKTDKVYTEDEMKNGNFNDPNFVKYYLYAGIAKNNISSIYSWLFEALENNKRTENMVDITKYMLYKATDNDYGITEFDFESYNEGDFGDFSDSGYADATGDVAFRGEINDENMLEWQQTLENTFGLGHAPKNQITINRMGESDKRIPGYTDSMINSIYLCSPINTMEVYQCTWWVYGRASAYLGEPYPVNGSYGNGDQWFAKNLENGWFGYRTGAKTKFYCIIQKGRIWTCCIYRSC